ncbi:TerB family tellurite resistance protein [Poseidonibacter ostreae]|jgi:DnaJ like chaperone protein|uniref:DnaJ domain-containing protein n=1 Tax=Poseidonibacter ostreae TaxID=2654171 RepID=A0A6L4WX81_9BACT|nr:TerB family tellurite resistance protein [Poseidonibacter ostreae]KAB7887333.1 DnaJ domain-containing protein [Poseidonibacter ostreae]KAB7890242.1 DnaJ domain-containing protein [Poseidonibacter ostreae]KAB7890822.1 DnaJ domain-containing protein [Poseidonibacter ostreae]MAC84169.1 molecular chaperone DjlA [Arcobacter sp.]|tara:strand:+ start:4831 stop:5586 length:756 start_codon:yes stop_codon:yes gene_type:complete
MKIIVLLIIGFILYIIAKNYKTEKFKNINLKYKENFDGDLLNHEAGLLIALMAKVAKADGKVCELEAELLKHTFNDISSHFENNEEVREKLKVLYKEQKESFDNTLEICQSLYTLTKFDYSKRVKIMEYLLNLAFIDKEFSKTEKMIVEDISNALKIKKHDFENLINTFEAFYSNQASSNALSLEKAYEVLESNSSEDNNTIKKSYRNLVKQYHPDIMSGRGEAQNIIDEATKKLQEINEAYELIKKDRGI